jgi:hypothetical protein
LVCGLLAGCSVGPRTLEVNRLRYNEAVERTSEEQLLLNIVRLRYCATPSSLAVTSIAGQHELVKSLKLLPFFTTGGDVEPRSFTALLPEAELNAADRPTYTLTPLDDQEFTRKLFTPLPLEGVIYLSKTTWPITTVFRLWLENLNWVSNAETGSGPTPRLPPVYGEFLDGMRALASLEERKVIAFFVEEREDKLAEGIPAASLTARDAVEAAKAGYECHKDAGTGTWTLVHKKQQALLRVRADQLGDPDLLAFVRIFHLRPGATAYELTADRLDPFLAGAPPEGLTSLDLETRSLLQVLYFVSQGVEIPAEHAACGLAPLTLEPDGRVFDWQEVLSGLFTVHCSQGHHRPAHAAVAVCYAGYWFYIDERDRDTKSTFSLLMELSRLELTGKAGTAPLLTLPVGR